MSYEIAILIFGVLYIAGALVYARWLRRRLHRKIRRNDEDPQ